jgi:malonyl-CoA/methylmalonyl-CoA synthetase
VLHLALKRAQQNRSNTAIIDTTGLHSYQDLLDDSARIAAALLNGRADLKGERVAFLITPSYPWVATQWGIWRAGGIAVPLPMNSARPELEYILHDTQATTLIADEANAAHVEDLAPHVIYYDQIPQSAATLPTIQAHDRAMILYTSGTTSKPKGVVTTHANIAAQVTSLITAWEWTAGDRIVLCLPLHHIHGIINIVCCTLWAGATCNMLPRFNADAIWDSIGSDALTLFMAVPTIYVKLTAAWESYPEARRVQLTAAARKLRLMVCGSAALPVSTLQRWRELTGHTLLERYGMTEIGMALSNPLHGDRIPGSVGRPLPHVEVQLTNEDGTHAAPGTPGEIEVRGPNVFHEYWRRPEATHSAFRSGWFRTGDTAVLDDGIYRILGRTSIDILKSGGHKISALEIEEVLRTHPAISECAVVGLPDAEWGERVAAALVLHATYSLDLETLRTWARDHLANHKLPSRLLIVEALPRNAMGKVVKPKIVPLFQVKTK